MSAKPNMTAHRLNPDGSVTNESILEGATLHHDEHGRPAYLTWAGGTHWLTLWERFALYRGWTSVDRIACHRFPRRAVARAYLQRRLS